MKRISSLAVLGTLTFSLMGLTTSAFAAETESEAASADDDEFDFLNEGDEAAAQKADKAIDGDDFDPFELEDDDDYSAFGASKPAPAPAPAPRAAPASNMAALGDHFPVQVVQTLPSAVVVELPVVIGTRSEVKGDYWLVGEVFVDGQKVGESRQLVMASSLSESSATTYLKLHAPVSSQQGQVEVKVSQIVDGKSQALFGRQAAFRL